MVVYKSISHVYNPTHITTTQSIKIPILNNSEHFMLTEASTLRQNTEATGVFSLFFNLGGTKVRRQGFAFRYARHVPQLLSSLFLFESGSH